MLTWSLHICSFCSEPAPLEFKNPLQAHSLDSDEGTYFC
jgi:hypothetical protein